MAKIGDFTQDLSLATEMIDFQKDTTFEQVSAIFQDMIDYIEDNPNISRAVLDKLEWKGRLESFIFKRFGIKTTFTFNGDLACCYPLYMNKYHVLLNSFWHGGFEIKDQERFMRDSIGKTGTIDLKNAKVGGVFSEYNHLVMMDVKSLSKMGIDAKEIAGITLHEIGHLFTMLELSNRLQTTNQVLQKISGDIKAGAEIKQFEHVFKEIGKDYQLTNAEMEDICNTTNRYVLGFKLFTKIIGACGRQLRLDYYDRTAGEQVADQFTTRLGGGRYTVTGLQKMHEAYGAFDVSPGLANFSIFVDSITIVLGLAASIATVFFIPFLGLFVLGLHIFNIFLSGDALQDFTYDKLKDRYKRVRSDLIRYLAENIKENPDVLKVIVNDIKVIDEAIGKASNYRNVYARISNIIFSTNRKANQDHQLQQLLESLVNNDLYLKAAELNTI